MQSLTGIDDAVRAGLTECLTTGTTLLGDISSGGRSWSICGDYPVRALIFHELLGLTPERADQAWQEAEHWLTAHKSAPDRRPGLSPHAPYSVSRHLFKLTSQRAGGGCLPVAIHLAESPAELELLANQTGPMVAFLEGLGIKDLSGLVKSLGEVVGFFGGENPLLLVHGNYLNPATQLPPGSTLVYCPRTHAAFGHPSHPFQAFHERGIRIALGTDSRASNPDLNLLAEARYLFQIRPDLGARVIVHMATISGAEALGWESETGTLEAGKYADFIVVPIGTSSSPDPYEAVLGPASTVSQVYIGGRCVSRAGEILPGWPMAAPLERPWLGS
jgi:cytosine/adenosine deaminase-related metal-dependent hydrolase